MFEYDLPYYFAGIPFTARQVPRKLAWLLVRGEIRQFLKGVYVDLRVPDSPRLRADALRLVVPSDAVALGWHILPVRRADLWGSYPALELAVGAFLCQEQRLPRRW